MRFCISFIFLFLLLLPQEILASVDKEPPTFLTIKIYFEPLHQNKTLSYKITLPKEYTYSYYLGSDLPQWRYVQDNMIEGKFYPVELVNIRIHSPLKKLHEIQGSFTANIVIKDLDNAHVIWAGKINFENPLKTKIVTEVNNQKYYNTTIKLEKNILWIESTDKMNKL